MTIAHTQVMGILDRVFGRTPSPGATSVSTPAFAVGSSNCAFDIEARTVDVLLLSGDETLEVVGESYYQDALWRIVGGIREDRVRHDVVAMLLPEPDNEYDRNAIAVRISGLHVGYLSRHDAAAYLPGLRAIMEANPGLPIALEGVIVGGGEREDGFGRLGVFLEHDPADFGLHPPRQGLGELQAGRSNATGAHLREPGSTSGHLRGKHFTAYVEEVKTLRRYGHDDTAEKLLLELIDVIEADAAERNWGVAPWYYEQVAMICRKRHDPIAEVTILERFEAAPHGPGEGPTKLAARLEKARQLAAKATTP